MGIRLVALASDPVSEVTFDNVRLTANPASFHLKEYEWDKNGNRKVLNGPNQSAEGTQNRIQTDGTYNYEYDRANNTSTRTKISDDTQTVYTWDFHQRLSSVTEKNALGVVVNKIEYVYDAFDRRVGKRFDDDGDGTWDHLYAWLWDGQHEIMQMEDTDGPGTGQPFRTTHRYFYGDATDQLLADEQFMFNTGYAYSGGAFPNSGHNLWALADNLGSVRDVVDNAGAVRQHVEFDSFGIRLKEIDYNGAGAEIPADDLTAIDELFGYTGRDWDKDADLQYNRARWYDPTLGRWMSPDPIGFEAGDANLYRYVGNHPTSATDPSGLQEPYVHVQPPAYMPLGPVGMSRIRSAFRTPDHSIRLTVRSTPTRAYNLDVTVGENVTNVIYDSSNIDSVNGQLDCYSRRYSRLPYSVNLQLASEPMRDLMRWADNTQTATGLMSGGGPLFLTSGKLIAKPGLRAAASGALKAIKVSELPGSELVQGKRRKRWKAGKLLSWYNREMTLRKWYGGCLRPTDTSIRRGEAEWM